MVSEWEERVVKQWRKICNFLKKNTIVPSKREVYIERTRSIFNDLGLIEEEITHRII